MKNYATIDIESQGASTSHASIISIAGILVNPELQELDRFELYARNKPGFVPAPGRRPATAVAPGRPARPLPAPPCPQE